MAFDSQHWTLNVVAQLGEWACVFGIVTLVIFSLLGTKPRFAIYGIFLPPVLFLVYTFAPYWKSPFLGKASTVDTVSDKKVFYANIHSGNEDKSILLDYLKEKTPDLVLLVEFDSDWAKSITTLGKVYPYSKAIIQEGNFGMAVLSQTRIKIERVLIDRENRIPALYLSIEDNKKPFRVLLLHGFPPLGQYATLLRDRYLRTLAGLISEEPGPLLVCGDFNTTPWTQIFKEFVEVSELNHNHGKGLLRTWSPIGWPALPIDHCLTKNMKATDYRVGLDIQSDHKPLEINLLTSPNGRNQLVNDLDHRR